MSNQDTVPVGELEILIDELDNAAEQSLSKDESAYDAYERAAGRLVHIVEEHTNER